MQQNPINFVEWTEKYSTQEACLEELKLRRWKNGFICPNCGHDKSYQLKYRHLHECAKCGRQVSPTAGTVLEHTRLPLPKWFAAVYLMRVNKGRISAQGLSRKIDVSWPTAARMLKKLRRSMRGRTRGDCLEGLVKVNNSFHRGRRRRRRPKAKSR